MFRVEIAKAMHRLRTYVLGTGLALLAVLPVVVLATSSPSSTEGGPPFFDLIRHSGLVAAIAAVTLVQPFFLPLGTGLLAGEAIASEASNGTLRYLVARPVGRARLVLVKYAAVMAQLAAAIVWIAVIGLVAGIIAFGTGPLPTLSGTTLAAGPALLRIGAASLYILLGMAGLAAIGVFISTLTESGPGATAATVSIGIASQVLDNISSLHVVHPYLISHRWLAFVDLFRGPVEWSGIERGLILDAAYAAIFLSAAVWVFRRKDVVS
jgi:ABC-2 type transport system permease protein